MAEGEFTNFKNNFGAPIDDISFPFTAPSDGFVFITMSGRTGNGGYFYLKNSRFPSIDFFAGAVSSGGGRESMTVPVKKGDTLSISASNEYIIGTLVFFPLN